MLTLPGYELDEQLHQSVRTVVYRGKRLDPGEPVVVKAPRSPQPAAMDIARLGSEFELGKRIEHRGVVRMLALEHDGHRPALVMADIGGQTLAATLANRRLSLAESLDLAVQLADAVEALHRRGIIHKDINPSNIVHNPTTGQVAIIDLGIATVLDRESHGPVPTGQLEGTLHYIAPEQTGRMNRSVDYRSDFYSFGVTLYQMLCGRLPFDSHDPLELVHAHLARQPRPPAEVDPEIPPSVSALVMTLLAKTPEERYQSAHGLASDLRRLQEQLRGTGGIGPTELRSQDVSARFRIPERLYGRRRQIDRLHATLARAVEGSRQLLMITGPSGMGKSALAREIRRPTIDAGGWYISGKFDETHRAIPHSALVRALRELVLQLLTESDERIADWRETLRRTLQDDTSVLVELLPELEVLVGPDPEGPRLPQSDAERRLDRALQGFIRAVAGAGHPLVLFLDNLQWADPASLRLVERLLADGEIHHLLVIGGYRGEEVDQTHPVTLWLRATTAGPAEVGLIELDLLEDGHIAQLLAETLDRPTGEVGPLAELLRRQTLGNPLFVDQLLRALHSESMVWFDEDTRSWRWDLDAIAARKPSDDIAELMLQRALELPQATRQVLELAACIGTRFDIGTLATIAERPVLQVVDDLRPAVDEGIVRPLCSGFGRLLTCRPNDDLLSANDCCVIECEFVHDRFAQGAYERLPLQQRQRLHLRLGRLLRDNLSDDARDKRLFELVNHLNAGVAALNDVEERLDLARLNHAAGLKAQTAVAYDAAERYFRQGIELLPEDRWQRCYRLAFDLFIGRYECLTLLRSHGADALALGEELLRQTRDRVDHLRALGPHIAQMARSGKPHEALELALAPLRELDIDLDPPDLQQAIQAGYGELQQVIGGRPIAELASLPLMTDRMMLAVLDLMRVAMFPMWMRRRDLIPLASMTTVLLTLRHGTAPISGMAYAGWGRVVAHVFGDFRTGYQFGRLGIAVADARGVHQAGTRTMAVPLTAWLREPLAAVCEQLPGIIRLGVETGEPMFSGITAATGSSLRYARGEPLARLQRELASQVDLINNSLGHIGVREIDLTLRAIEALRGERPLPGAFFASDDEEREAFEVMRVRNPEGRTWYHLLRSQLARLARKPDQALRDAAEGERLVDRHLGPFARYDIVYHHALALAEAYRHADPDDRDRLRAELQQKLEQLSHWVEAGASANFHHKQLLVAAEVARIDEAGSAAAPAYERAVKAAAESGFTQDQAEANELAARFFLGLELDKLARVYLHDARYCYDKWGATAKVEQLEAEFPRMFDIEPIARPPTAEHELIGGRARVKSSSTNAQTQALDVEAVIKASQAISSEMLQGSLLTKLLGVVVEHAGAERGFLVLRRQGKPTIEAGVDHGAAWPLAESQPLRESDALSAGIVLYVMRTGQEVVLGDAGRKGRFQSDPYVDRRKPRSVLCVPLLHQGKLQGAVYLENNLARDAFTAQRLEVVNLLCAQAAISIENARLYTELEQSNRQLADYSRTLEQKVAARTADLAEKNAQLNASLKRQQEMQDQLLISEKMASLGNLVAGVAHEINTPIGAVLSTAETSHRALQRVKQALDQSPAGEDERLQRLLDALLENHQVIATASERVGEIVRTLRNFARLDEAERKAADLHEGIESTLTLVRHRTKRTVEVEKDYGTLPQVLCYPNQINQVFMNLMINAIDAIDQRAVEAERTGAAFTGTIAIRTWADQGQAFVQFRDNGRGIPAEVRRRIFEPGFTTKSMGLGTGLGLSICYTIVQKHGGAISVESAEGQGATFTVALPLR